jgi:hypothetical protein
MVRQNAVAVSGEISVTHPVNSKILKILIQTIREACALARYVDDVAHPCARQLAIL